MALTLLQYKDRLAKKGVPALGDADTQLTYCINLARKIVWSSYDWPFKRVISEPYAITSAASSYSIAAINSTLKTIHRVVDVTNGRDVWQADLDSIIDGDRALDDVGTSPTHWCHYTGGTILFWPTLSSGTTVNIRAYGEKQLTELTEDSTVDTDITDNDLAEAVILIAHARVSVENDDLVKKTSEYRDATSYISTYARNNYETRIFNKRTPGWNIYTGNTRKK